jgi:hypothetical protein
MLANLESITTIRAIIAIPGFIDTALAAALGGMTAGDGEGDESARRSLTRSI